jgi:hypothetical protein
MNENYKNNSKELEDFIESNIMNKICKFAWITMSILSTLCFNMFILTFFLKTLSNSRRNFLLAGFLFCIAGFVAAYFNGRYNRYLRNKFNKVNSDKNP